MTDGAAMNEAPQDIPPAPDDGWEWAIVEVFGHRKHAGRVREEERFGAKLLRIDIPVKGDATANGWETHYYGGSSLFSFTPCSEETAIRLNKPYEPPARFSLPAPEDAHEDGGFTEDEQDFP